MPGKLCEHETEQWKLTHCADTAMNSALYKASCVYLNHTIEEMISIFKVPGYFTYSLEQVPALLHDCLLSEICIQHEANRWYLIGANCLAGPLWLADDPLSFPRSMRPHLLILKDARQTFRR